MQTPAVANREGTPDGGAALNPAAVKESFAHIEPHAEKAMAYFYGRLFATSPEMRALFPMAMDRQRDRFFRSLSRVVWSLDCPEQLTAYLRELGRDHRRFGVASRHYRGFMDALLATLREFGGPAWSGETATAWEAALATMSRVMIEAAEEDAKHAPSWWLAEVVGHQRRAADLAVLTVRPDQPLDYLPGQYVAVQSARWPREWRNYSIANAPRPDGTLTMHVRAVPGGLVSPALVHHTAPGDTLLLGPAKGQMTVAPACARDLLCVAGGTGLAPIKAIAEQAAAAGRPAITLLFGARTEEGLYDLRDLELLAASCPSFKLVTAVSGEPGSGGLHGTLAETVTECPEWQDREVYICGPAAMVCQTRKVLTGLGVPAGRLHYDEPDPACQPPGASAPEDSGQTAGLGRGVRAEMLAEEGEDPPP
jgi:NAD(P)H-flavin reductase/hemoglobin-like flavoprotein